MLRSEEARKLAESILSELEKVEAYRPCPALTEQES